MEIFGIILFFVYLSVIVYVLVALGRIAAALERTSRHLLEMARDIKSLTHHIEKRDSKADL